MKRYELVVIGAGPSGLSAAAEAASHGMETILFDENALPGGQLFKQIHKFFGSKEHKAKIRGIDIGGQLVTQAQEAGAHIELNSTVIGIYEHKDICVMRGDALYTCKADNIIVATGAAENVLAFPGSTLPGVMGAGAAQTLMNLHGVQPGKRVLMMGSGNVGLVVGLQLMQAGCELAAIVDAAPRIGGYGVHAAKVARTGVPFHLGHTIVKAEGDGHVQRATIAQVDSRFQPIPGTEKTLEVDVICLAVGLTPMYHLASMAGAKLIEEPKKGGLHPEVTPFGETSIPGVFAAGDVTGIEEASSAMIGGRIAGAAAAMRGGYLTEEAHLARHKELVGSLDQLRQGMFAGENKGNTSITTTSEGIDLSMSLLQKGFLEEGEVKRFPGYQSGKQGFHPVVECTQNIPCNPCQDVCPKGCIQVGERIVDLPVVQTDAQCIDCGLCVSACPGQAVFLVDENYEPGYAAISLPYEFLPLPEVGTKGVAVNRSGAEVGEAEVIRVKDTRAFDRTPILTIKVETGLADSARFFKAKEVAADVSNL